MPHLPPFCPGQSAADAHQALQASVAVLDQAQHGAVVWFGEIARRQLYRELGYSSMRQYAIEGLGFSSTRAGDFMRLAAKLENLPAVSEELASGRLGYTKVREIVSVADRANERQWLQVAGSQSRRQLAATVRQARLTAAAVRRDNPAQGELVPRPAATVPPAAAPVRVSFELTPAQYARYEALVARLGRRATKAELLLEALAALDAGAEVAPRGATGPAHQIHIHECPTCQQAAVETPRGEVVLDPQEAAAVHCDARVHRPGQRAASTIPPKTRREVLARDRHRCRREGCNHTRHLHLHHLVPRAAGGGHTADNLVTLCPACHALWHEKGGALRELLRTVRSAAEQRVPEYEQEDAQQQGHDDQPEAQARD